MFKYQYIDTLGRPHNVQTESYEEARDNYHWGTYGIEGKDPLTYKRVIDLSTTHLEAIIVTQKHIEHLLRKIIIDELQSRKNSLPEDLFKL